MGIDEKERERAILDATAELLLRHGYNKVTMSDVADAVGLNRRVGLSLVSFKGCIDKSPSASGIEHLYGSLESLSR